MSKSLETGEKKIQEICNLLKKETLEPAQEKANAIVASAHAQAEKILHEAKLQADQLRQEVHQQLEQDRKNFQNALVHASRQAIESLKQSIENELLNPELQTLLKEATKDPHCIAALVQALTNAVEKEGLQTDLAAVIPQTVSVDKVNALLADGVLKRLQKQSVQIGTLAGGVQLRLDRKQMTLDMSDQTLQELLGNFVRKEFRKWIFSS